MRMKAWSFSNFCYSFQSLGCSIRALYIVWVSSISVNHLACLFWVYNTSAWFCSVVFKKTNTLLLFPSVLMLQHFTLTLLRNIQYQCKNSPVSKNDEIQSSHHRATPPPLCWLDVCSQDVGRASSLRCCGLARLWVVTSCSILFLCRCASALRPPGLTLHCSSNNCCGTPNICKPPLLLTQLPLCWAAVCVCVCVFPAQLVRLCAAHTLMLVLFGTSCVPLCPRVHSTSLQRGLFNVAARLRELTN